MLHRGGECSGFEGFDFSHQRVKLIGLFTVVFTPYLALHASSCTLTTNTQYKKQKENARYVLDSLPYRVFLSRLLYFRI